jgi:hypothetical protein
MQLLVEIRCGVLVAMRIEISDPSIMRFAVAARENGAELNDREIQQTVANLHRTHSASGAWQFGAQSYPRLSEE